MSIDQPRTPAGSPTGGQYAATDRPESDVDLEPASDPRRVKAEQLAAALAEATGGDAGAVLREVSTERSCGVPAGAHPTRLALALDDAHGTEVTLRYDAYPDGGVRDLTAFAEYPLEAQDAEDFGWATNSVGVSDSVFADRLDDTAAATRLVESVIAQAHQQRGLDARINYPQYRRRQAERERYNPRGSSSVFDVFEAKVVVGGPDPTVELRDRGWTGSRAARLQLSRTGRIAEIELDTGYGSVRVKDADNIENVASNIERSLSGNLEGAWTGDRAALEHRLREAMSAAG